jgi:hypothetical protein
VGKVLIVVGVILVVTGVLMTLAPHSPLIGKLPGDFHIRGKNYHVFIPLTTSILLSVLLTVLLNLFLRR